MKETLCKAEIEMRKIRIWCMQHQDNTKKSICVYIIPLQCVLLSVVRTPCYLIVVFYLYSPSAHKDACHVMFTFLSRVTLM